MLEIHYCTAKYFQSYTQIVLLELLLMPILLV